MADAFHRSLIWRIGIGAGLGAAAVALISEAIGLVETPAGSGPAPLFLWVAALSLCSGALASLVARRVTSRDGADASAGRERFSPSGFDRHDETTEEIVLPPADPRQVELANLHLASRLRELTLLHDVTRSLTSTLELDELFRRLTELIGATRQFDSFAILTMDDEHSGLTVRTSFGFLPALDPSGIRLPFTDDTCGRVVQSREHLFTTAIPMDRSRLEGLGWTPSYANLLTVAMKHKDRVEGLLVFARGSDRPFAVEDVELLRNISGQAALAISNARLFEQTVKLSLTDPLTGLHNRRHFFARLDLEVMRARRYDGIVSVAMIDIDHFKNLNDTSGHAAGDVVLQVMAEILQSNVRRVDTVARYGGEEFCVILPNVTKVEAGVAAEKVRRLIEESNFPGGEGQPGGRITASVGYATFPEDADDVDSLLDAADVALYAAKRGGRNRSLPFDPALRPSEPKLVAPINKAPAEPASAEPAPRSAGSRAS